MFVSATSVSLREEVKLTTLINIILTLLHLVKESRGHQFCLLTNMIITLRQNHDLLPRNLELLDHLAEELLADAVRVHGCRIPGVDAAIIGCFEEFECFVLFNHEGNPLRGADGHPAEDWGGNAQTRRAETDIVDFGGVEGLLEGRGDGHCEGHDCAGF